MTISLIEGWPGQAPNSQGCIPGLIPLGLPLAKAWPDQKLSEEVEDILVRQVTVPSDCQSELWDESRRLCFRYRLTPLQEGGSAIAGDVAAIVKGVHIIATDITHMLEAEEQLRRAEAERTRLVACEAAVQEASRMKTEYFTHISHEIRTPLAGIISAAELLLADPLLESEQRLLVSQALRSGEILLELVGMVLDLRKIESGELVLEHIAFRTADLIRDAQLLSVLVKRKVMFRKNFCLFVICVLVVR